MTCANAPLALVTGGSGYFGCCVVGLLRERGYRVRVFDLVDVPDRPSDVTFVQGDIRDARAVADACAGVEIVHHNVAQVPLAKDRDLFQSVNVGGARVLFNACLAAHVRKVINVSSSAVYGVPARNPVDRLVEPRPQEAYGRAKWQGELVAREFIQRGLDVTTIRPRTILGHGRLGIFQILFELVRTGRAVYVLGRGDNRFQFVHAADLADACIRAGERVGPATYLVGAGRFGTMRDMLEALVAHAATGSRVRGVPLRPAVAAMRVTSRLGLSPLGPYHALMYGRDMYFDVTDTMGELDWAPQFGNSEMICESYDYYLRNRDEILARKHASHHRSAVRFGVLSLLKHLP